MNAKANIENDLLYQLLGAGKASIDDQWRAAKWIKWMSQFVPEGAEMQNPFIDLVLPGPAAKASLMEMTPETSPSQEPAAVNTLIYNEAFDEGFEEGNKERIIGSAIRYGNVIFSLGPLHRHHEIIGMMASLKLGPECMHDQGFTTSFGRFVDRKEGLAIAKSMDQIKMKTGNPGELFSEDIW